MKLKLEFQLVDGRDSLASMIAEAESRHRQLRQLKK